MKPGYWGKLKTVITAFFAGATRPSSEDYGQPRSNSPASGKFGTLYNSVNLLVLLRFNNRGERNCMHGFEDGAAMKISLFPVNMDKFTGFFDKFLKSFSPSNGCNQKSYHINLSATHSNSATEKFSGCPAFPRTCPHLLA